MCIYISYISVFATSSLILLQIKNGLGQFEMGPRSFNHIFDAYAKLHSWKFSANSTVAFTCKFIHTNSYKAGLELQDVAPYLLFQSSNPPFNDIEKMQSLLRGIDNTNVNIYKFGKGDAEMTAVSDFWQSYQFNMSTLETISRVNDPVPGGGLLEASGLPLQSSSHPMREYGTNNAITFVSSMNPIPFFSSKMRLVRIKNLHEREEIAEISVDQVPYMHSFGMSKKYAVLFGQPMYTNLKRLLMTAEPVKSLDWFPKRPTILYVVNIQTGKVIKLPTEAVFMMHHVNSFELNRNKLIVDAVTYPDIEFIKTLQVEYLVDKSKRHAVTANPTLKRFMINLRSGRVTVTTFPLTPGVEGAASMDLPAINENYRYRRYCYVYGVVLKADQVHLENVTLVKRDLCRPGRDMMWSHAGHHPTEPWFIAKPGATKEDSGYLLSVVLDGQRKQSYLGIFDARTMRRVNKGYVPTTVPFSLHGRFFPSEEN